VLSALPAIDFGPPADRHHVTCKLKKLQWEGERRQKIEEENFKLLQRMGAIMNKNRLGNHWQIPPPDFLHRVGIYPRTRSPTPHKESTAESPVKPEKKRSCSACTPSPAKPVTIPEDRVPWAPPKERLSRRNSGSVFREPLSDFLYIEKATKPSLPAVSPVVKKPPRSKSSPSKDCESVNVPSINKMYLCQGPLRVRVNFPAETEVTVISGNNRKIIQMNKCKCTAITVSRKK